MAIATSITRKAKAALVPLSGHRVDMRAVTAGDLPALLQWDEDPAITALMGRQFAETSIHEWFEALKTDHTSRAWAIQTKEGRLIGELELAHLNWREGSAELRICIGEKDCWSHGYGTDSIRCALNAAFGQYGLRSVYLRVFATNTRAIHTYERLGFRKEAVLQPSSRREDPAPIVLMRLTAFRWQAKWAESAQAAV